ncbi:MAG TPA: histidinol-phosphatase [Candidatus Hydrogenedentes bacterium]|nr:histidinol-phosphatase [Candidatus Hydrogenedentota bacterium]HPG69630.1 histidinol-phosphatase [Candidatus Hydrogenedentota bacterium]
MIEKNYHTHTYRCKHATGDVADYCRRAVAEGLSVLGMSDHAALPDNRWIGVRMAFTELDAYCRAVDDARAAFPDLVVLKAMECEYDDGYAAYFRDELLGRCGMDYLIGAAHWFPHEGDWHGIYGNPMDPAGLRAYTRYVARSMESGLFAFMAHPDLFACSYIEWDEHAIAASREILAAAEALRMPLEINGYGLIKPLIETPDGIRRMYPIDRFWELAAEYDIRVVVNSDAHHVADLIGATDKAFAIAERYGLAFANLDRLEVAYRPPAPEASEKV